MWDKEYELLDATCSRKFRDFKVDVNQWIIKDWQIVSGEFSSRSIHAGKRFAIKDVNDARQYADVIKNMKTFMVCINDHISDETYKEAAETIKTAFKKKL